MARMSCLRIIMRGKFTLGLFKIADRGRGRVESAREGREGRIESRGEGGGREGGVGEGKQAGKEEGGGS